MGKDDVGGEGEQFSSVLASIIGIAASPAVIDPDVIVDDPTQSLEPQYKRPKARLAFRIVNRDGHQYTDAPHPTGLLRSRRDRPRRSRAAKRDELAPSHS